MKKIITFFATVFCMICIASTAFAMGWEQDASGIWKYQNEDGTYVSNGWKEVNKVWYYFDANGNMLANTTTPDGYHVDASGAWIQNWQNTAVNRVLYEDREVTITGLSFAEEKPYKWSSSTELVLRINIVNKTGHNICVQVRDEVVNGMACDAVFSCDVPANSQTNDEITWYDTTLAKQGITPASANTVRFKFTTFTWDSWSDNNYSEDITVTK